MFAFFKVKYSDLCFNKVCAFFYEIGNHKQKHSKNN